MRSGGNGAAIGGALSLKRTGTFGPAAERPYRRRVSDWIRLVCAVALLSAGAWRLNGITPIEKGLFEFVNSLPNALSSMFRGLYAVAALWAIALVIAAAVVGRRWRLARDLAVAGAVAWFLARVVATHLTQRSVDFAGLSTTVRWAPHVPQYPVARLAVVCAVVCVASPYLTRPTRRVGDVIVTALVIASMYLGTGYPNDVLAGILLGWGVAAGVHLVFGSPGGRPTTAQVQAALQELGVETKCVELSAEQPVDATAMFAQTVDGITLTIKVLGRDEASAQFLTKLWRFITYKTSGPSLFLNRRQQVEHEAYALLLAQEGGVHVPSVVVAGKAGPNAALLVLNEPRAKRMSESNDREVDDHTIDLVWKEVRRLHDQHVAHGALNTNAVVLSKAGPVITSFGRADGGAPDDHLNRDVAELLITMALVAGDERVVQAALNNLGREQLIDVMPLLQPQACSYDARRIAKRGVLKERADAVRKTVARYTDVSEPQLIQLQRISPANLAMAIGTLFAVGVLLTEIGDPQVMWDTLKGAEWSWLVGAFIVVMATNIAWAVGTMGAVPIRLPLWEATEVQVAMSFATLALPGVGPTALQVRYLQKRGMTISAGVASSVLSQTGYVVTQIFLFIIAVFLAPSTFHSEDLPTSSIYEGILLIIALCFVCAGILLGIPKLRRLVMPHVKQASVSVWEVLRSPTRLVLLLGGNSIAGLISNVALLWCLIAFGGREPFWTLMVVNIAVGTLAGLVPIPGGNTAVATIGMSGGLTAIGVPDAVAVATVLGYQLIGSYLSGLPGWFATRDLMKRQII